MPAKAIPKENNPTEYMPTKNFIGPQSCSGVSSVVKSEVAMLRSSCIFRTVGGVSDSAKELETSKERLRINTAKNFTICNILNFAPFHKRKQMFLAHVSPLFVRIIVFL